MNALEEQESDYDVFAAVRPKRRTPIDSPISNKGQPKDDFDPFAEVRPKIEMVRAVKQEKQAQKNKPTTSPTASNDTIETIKNVAGTVKDTIKDVAKQGVKETLIGLGGTHGDIASLLTDKTQTKAQEEHNSREFNTLQRMEQPGYEPTWADIMSLDDDMLLPRASRGPTSKELRKINEMVGGPGEAETTAGKYAGRAGKLYGSGLALGPLVGGTALNPMPAIVAGALGQTVEEMGGGPVAQAAAEILGLLVTPTGSFKKLTSTAERQALKDLGYSDEAIVLAENYASKGKKFNIKASKSSKTEQAFKDATEHSDEMVTKILTDSIPGLEKGTEHVHQLASDVYGEMAKQASDLVIKNANPFLASMKNVMKELKVNLGQGTEATALNSRFISAAKDAKKQPTAKHFIEFYKELGGLGKWMGRSNKDRLLRQVREGIKDSIRSEGPAGERLAIKFDKANEGITKAYAAEDAHNLIEKTRTQDGINYKQLNKVFDKKDNVKLFEKVLGKKQADNLRLITQTGKKITDFDKAYKSLNVIGSTIPTTASQLAYMTLTGNWMGAAAFKGGEIIARKLAELSLTDPKFQNLIIRGLHSVQVESPKLFRVANDEIEKYINKKINQKSNHIPKDQK